MKAIATLALLAGMTMATEWRSRPAYRTLDYSPYSYGRGYGYKAPVYTPTVVKKDYGVWEKYYRLEVEDFKQTVVTDTENVWVVAYIDPACGGCKRLAVEWERLTTVETIRVRKVKFGYVDVTVEANKEILQTYTAGKSVEYTPTIFLYGDDKYSPVLYDGDYKFDSLNSWICGYCDDHGYGIIADDYDLGYGYGLGLGHGRLGLGRRGLGLGHGRLGLAHGRRCGRVGYGRVGYGRVGYGLGLGYGRGLGYGAYDDGLYGGYGYGSYGYGAPKVVGAYGASRTNRVVKTDYDRDVLEGRDYGAYERTRVIPGRAHYW